MPSLLETPDRDRDRRRLVEPVTLDSLERKARSTGSTTVVTGAGGGAPGEAGLVVSYDASSRVASVALTGGTEFAINYTGFSLGAGDAVSVVRLEDGTAMAVGMQRNALPESPPYLQPVYTDSFPLNGSSFLSTLVTSSLNTNSFALGNATASGLYAQTLVVRVTDGTYRAYDFTNLNTSRLLTTSGGFLLPYITPAGHVTSYATVFDGTTRESFGTRAVNTYTHYCGSYYRWAAGISTTDVARGLYRVSADTNWTEQKVLSPTAFVSTDSFLIPVPGDGYVALVTGTVGSQGQPVTVIWIRNDGIEMGRKSSLSLGSSIKYFALAADGTLLIYTAGVLHRVRWDTTLESSTNILNPALGTFSLDTPGNNQTPRGLALNSTTILLSGTFTSGTQSYPALLTVRPTGSQVVWQGSAVTGGAAAAGGASVPIWGDAQRSLINWQYKSTLYRAALT